MNLEPFPSLDQIMKAGKMASIQLAQELKHNPEAFIDDDENTVDEEPEDEG